MNPTAMLFSPINPMSIGLKAPPATPITIYDEAFLVRVPMFESPSAKIVGNMIDIKKKVVYRAYNDILPRARITRSMHTDEIKENRTSLFKFSDKEILKPTRTKFRQAQSEQSEN